MPLGVSLRNTASNDLLGPLSSVIDRTRSGPNISFESGPVDSTQIVGNDVASRTLEGIKGGQVPFGAPSSQRPRGNINLAFPDDLGAVPNHRMTFEVRSTVGLGSGLLDSALGTIAAAVGLNAPNLGLTTNVAHGSIHLPVPANLGTAYNIQYVEKELGPAGILIKQFEQNMYGLGDRPQATLGAAGAQVAGLAASLINDSKGIVAASAKVALGVALNPQKIVLLHGVNLRKHSFQYRLSPRNRAETDLIQQIISKFKMHAHPSLTGGGLFFTYPEFFIIRTNSQYTFDIGPSVLDNVSVEYHGQGFPAYHRDSSGAVINAPAEITLGLRFTETEIITKERLSNSGGFTSSMGINL